MSPEIEEHDYHVDPHLVFHILEKIKLAKRLPQTRKTTLCRLCLNMSVRTLDGDKYRHIHNLWDLPKSAATCEFCSLVEKCIQAPTAVTRAHMDFAGALRVAGIDEGEIVQLIIRPDGNLLDLCFIRQGESEEELLTTTAIKLFTDSPAPSNNGKVLVPLGMVISPVPNLRNIGTLVITWIEECRLKHLECNSQKSDVGQRLPTRVLDTEHVRLTGRLRLLHTGSALGKYIALSHSWGGHQPAKTVRLNLAARCAGFPLSELPLTFRDAVAVAIEIGIQYIWIDSLCIIQDDPEDWKREAATMGDVYLHSYLTIAATRAANSEAGFLGPRSFTHTVQVRLADVTSGADDRNIYACQRRSFANDVDDGPLNRRAWVLQERVLSPRTLHFTEHQVYWECWEYHQGEDLEYQYLGVMKKEAFPVQFSPRSLLCNSPARSPRLPRGLWYLFSEYSSFGLTFQTDKLVAIGGLVQKLESRLQINYLKGVWKEFLHHSVLWSARTEDLEYLPLIGAPSWSWASRNGPVNFVQLYDYDPVSNFMICETSGSLFVHGALAKLSPRLRISDTRWSDPATDETAFPPELDYMKTRYRLVQNHHNSVLGWVTLDIEIETQNDSSHLFWVLVAKDVHSHEGTESSMASSPSKEQQRHYCLLVQQDDGGFYKRVGIGSIETTQYLEFCNKGVLIA
ncbi:heterokaryon incompatibility protein-domain-containing protein [Xylaria arbuscula]|nr:heterokaryon incompatibility protein-domain-containing protein [Xylaria arbuscula]